MRVIFEGPDLVGKSTLVSLVAAKLGMPIRGRITRVGPSQVLFANAEDFAQNPNSVLDRCYWLSDLVYEPINTGNASVCAKPPVYQLLAKDEHSIYVYVTASDEVLRERMKTRGDELLNIEQIITASHRYDDFFFNVNMKYLLTVDTSSTNVDENVERITNYIQEVINNATN